MWGRPLLNRLTQEEFVGGTAHLNLKIQIVSIGIFKICSRFDAMAIEKLFNSLEHAIVMMFMKWEIQNKIEPEDLFLRFFKMPMINI